MARPRNRVVQVTRFGGPDVLRVVDTPMPHPRRGEVLVRVLASSLEYTDVTIRRHLYPWVRRRPPFVLGYDVVGEIEKLGPGVTGWKVGDRVADMTVLGSNAAHRTLDARRLTRVPDGVDPADAAAMILSWTTAYQMLHRTARVKRGQRLLVQGAAGAVGQALVTLAKLAGGEVWGTARAEHAALLRELGATPIDYRREDFTKVLPGGFDVIFDGVGEDGFRRSLAALKPGGLLVAFGYVAAVKTNRPRLTIWSWLARLALRNLIPGGKRTRVFSINVLRARHPAWFREDLGHLFELLASGVVRPHVAEQISFDAVAAGHRRLEAGGLEGKLILRPELPAKTERVVVPPRTAPASVEGRAPLT